MTYPMKLRKITLKHKGGTKRYFLIQVTAPNGNSLLIKRFGPVAKFGQVIVERHSSGSAAEAEFESTLREKNSSRKGYVRDGVEVLDEIKDGAELYSKLGRALWPKLGGEAINFLDPTIDTSTMRQAAEDPEYDEEGNYLGPRAPILPPRDTAADAAAAEAQRDEELAGVKSHPNFGMFA